MFAYHRVVAYHLQNLRTNSKTQHAVVILVLRLRLLDFTKQQADLEFRGLLLYQRPPHMFKISSTAF